jgi:hypothetical protein
VLESGLTRSVFTAPGPGRWAAPRQLLPISRERRVPSARIQTTHLLQRSSLCRAMRHAARNRCRPPATSARSPCCPLAGVLGFTGQRPKANSLESTSAPEAPARISRRGVADSFESGGDGTPTTAGVAFDHAEFPNAESYPGGSPFIALGNDFETLRNENMTLRNVSTRARL